MYKKYKDKNYEFMYYQITYNNSTTPYTEYVRHKLYKKLIFHIISVLKEEKVTLKSGNKKITQIIGDNLAMFIALNLMEKKHLEDPLIPYNARKNTTFIKTLSFLGNINMEKAKEVFKKIKLCKHLNSIVKEVEKTKQDNEKVVKKGNKYTYKDVTLFIEHQLYKKLKNRYKSNNLENDIFCLLLRYKTFGGNSHQFAMEIKFKNMLRKKYNINFECFASAINVHYDHYCSLFYDIEKHFGSYGNFYLVKYIRGFYIANPPYETVLLEKMVKKFIDSCKESNQPLSISYGLPNWGAYEKFKPLEMTRKSKFLSYIRCMKKGEVFWYDRLNNKKIKIPSHCRSIIQNTEGKQENNIDDFDNIVNNYWVA